MALYDQLREVPKDEVIVIQELHSVYAIPIGLLAHQAADKLQMYETREREDMKI